MATKKEETIEIRPLDIQTVPIRIVGDDPLIVHAWSEKAKRQLAGLEPKISKKEPRRPVEDFINSMYWLEGKPTEYTMEAFDDAVRNGAKWGFPVGAIKQAANSAAYRMGWVKNQMALRGSYFLGTEWGEMAEIKGSVPVMREDLVRVSNMSPDIRYRGMFENWYMDFELKYNASGVMSLSDIINCISAGGYVCGIGEWRPEKDGSFGRFHIETA